MFHHSYSQTVRSVSNSVLCKLNEVRKGDSSTNDSVISRLKSNPHFLSQRMRKNLSQSSVFGVANWIALYNSDWEGKYEESRQYE